MINSIHIHGVDKEHIDNAFELTTINHHTPYQGNTVPKTKKVFPLNLNLQRRLHELADISFHEEYIILIDS